MNPTACQLQSNSFIDWSNHFGYLLSWSCYIDLGEIKKCQRFCTHSWDWQKECNQPRCYLQLGSNPENRWSTKKNSVPQFSEHTWVKWHSTSHEQAASCWEFFNHTLRDGVVSSVHTPWAVRWRVVHTADILTTVGRSVYPKITCHTSSSTDTSARPESMIHFTQTFRTEEPHKVLPKVQHKYLWFKKSDFATSTQTLPSIENKPSCYCQVVGTVAVIAHCHTLCMCQWHRGRHDIICS